MRLKQLAAASAIAIAAVKAAPPEARARITVPGG